MRNFSFKKKEILARLDLVEVVGEHVALRQRGRRYVGLCPFHFEKTPSFVVTPDLGLFKCFGCGKGGDLFSFVEHRENVSFREALQILADRAGVVLDEVSSSAPDSPTRGEIAKINAWAARFFRSNLLSSQVGEEARAYLKGRGLSEASAERFGLGLTADGGTRLTAAAANAGISQAQLVAADLVRESERGSKYDTFRNRLMFPIRDATGRVLGFGGRTLVDDPAKYLNTRQTALFDKGRCLYGVDVARRACSAKGRVLVVEGYTDCLAVHQAGFAETVATLGVALSEEQVDLLRRYCHEIILLFDSDDAGEAAAERGIRVAYPRCVRVRLARIPTGKDPAEYLASSGADAFSDVLKEAVDALEFKWLKTCSHFKEHGSDAARRDAIMDFLGIIGEACATSAVDAVQRGLLINQVAHLLRMDGHEVNRVMKGLRRRRSTTAEPARNKDERRAVVDEEQAAWVTVLEVLLAAPAPLKIGEPLPDPARIADETDRRIALAALDLIVQEGACDLASLLARCTESGDAGRIEELVRRGLAKGNFEKSLSGAAERIRRARFGEEIDRGKQRLSGPDLGAGLLEKSRQQLTKLGNGLREHSHFVPRRKQRSQSRTYTETTPLNDIAALEQS